MSELHANQKKILDLLKKFPDEGLSIRDIQERIGVSSPSVVHHHILQLEKKGYLRRDPNNPSDYQVLAENPDKEITYLNVYGLAQCGPGGRLLDGHPAERVPISSKMLGFPSSQAFMVKARGESMAPAISENDYVIAKKDSSPIEGEIVVCVNDGQAMIKRYSRSQRKIVLESVNTKFRPIIASEDFRVEGVVKGIYKYPSK